LFIFLKIFILSHLFQHIITTDSYDQTSASKLPSVQQEKPRRSDTLNKQQIPISDRSEIKHLSSSHATSPSEDDRPTHWTKQILIPSIHLTDDEILSSREDQPRPKSPNVEQIAERNPPVPSPPITTAKKRGKQRKRQDFILIILFLNKMEKNEKKNIINLVEVRVLIQQLIFNLLMITHLIQHQKIM